MLRKKTLLEKLIACLMGWEKKNKFFKIPALFCIILVLCIHRVFLYFTSNGKKFLSIGAACLFFMVSSSFSFIPEVEAGAEQGATLDVIAAIGQDQEETTVADIEVLDDSDVLDGYEDEELNKLDNIDKYTMDEILAENKDIYFENSTLHTDTDIVFDKDDWRLVLINKQHPIPEGYTFQLGTIKGAMKCDERILDDLLAMLQGAKREGVNLVICSPYRDLNRQEVLFNRKVKTYMSRGMSYMEAYKIASQAVTVPGASEHQIGLALDIVTDDYALLNEGFGETEAGKWLAKHSCEYGFILRYPKGKEYITSIEYEPWHFRYVGKEAAMIMTQRELTLEEFVEGL